MPRHLQDEIAAAFKKVHSEFFPEGTLKSPDIGRIISSTHRQRLQNLLDSTDGEVVLGGGVAGDTKMEITIVKDVQIDDPLMAECVSSVHVPVAHLTFSSLAKFTAQFSPWSPSTTLITLSALLLKGRPPSSSTYSRKMNRFGINVRLLLTLSRISSD